MQVSFKLLDGRTKICRLDKYRVKWNGKSRSKFQEAVKEFLSVFWFTQFVYEEMPVFGTKMKIDFYNANKRIAIEVDGAQHGKFNAFFHQNDRMVYAKHIMRDHEKNDWCELNDITMIRIVPSDLPLTESFFERLGVSL
jgi:very-short-patch-repair endonuclease